VKKVNKKLLVLAVASLTLPVLAAGPAPISDTGVNQEALAKILPTKPPYSPYAGRTFSTRPLFGDTHVHTSYSDDKPDTTEVK